MYLIALFIAISAGFTTAAQQYKTVADTINLNKEYLEVSNEIASLTAKLAIARNNLPGYQSKASDASADAQDAASASSVQADKATRGNVKDARRAKRKARKAYREAKDLRSAGNNVADQNEKINTMASRLDRKKERLQELDTMRTAIYAQLP